jgi:antitoxin Phd
MQTMNYRAARENFRTMLDNAENGEAVEITRRGRPGAVLISKAEYEAFKVAKLAAEMNDLFSTFDKTNKALSDR